MQMTSSLCGFTIRITKIALCCTWFCPWFISTHTHDTYMSQGWKWHYTKAIFYILRYIDTYEIHGHPIITWISTSADWAPHLSSSRNWKAQILVSPLLVAYLPNLELKKSYQYNCRCLAYYELQGWFHCLIRGIWDYYAALLVWDTQM